MMKVGFAGDDAPRAVFPTIVGRLKPKIVSMIWLTSTSGNFFSGLDESRRTAELNFMQTGKMFMLVMKRKLKEVF